MITRFKNQRAIREKIGRNPVSQKIIKFPSSTPPWMIDALTWLWTSSADELEGNPYRKPRCKMHLILGDDL